jgi:RNA polymerase primary sigma factor
MLTSNTQTELLSNNSTQQYFKEINEIYNKHDNNYNIEYCPENRNKLIEMNLKTVISIAKKYQGLGLSLNELISAGNLGLVIAWDKFDPHRSELKDNILNIVNEFEDEVTYEYFDNSVKEYLSYGDIRKKFDERFIPHNTYKKSDVIKWINANIYNAKFNSIATMWIRAYILIEIDNNSRIVKKPKTEIYKDKEEFGAYKKEVTVDINAPLSDSSDVSFGDILSIEDNTRSELEVSEAYDTFKNGLNLLLDGVKTRDRAIFLKKFGIGLPRPMLPKEIADQEGLSIARISQIFQTVMEQMQKNQIKYDINPDILFDAVKKIQ